MSDNTKQMFPWAEQLKEAVLRGGVDIGGMPVNDAMQAVVGRIAFLTEQLEAARRVAKEAEAYARELEGRVLTATYALRAMASQDGAAINGERFVFMAQVTLEQMESPQCPRS